jgi:uncharacterized protein (DUF305 family)
MKSTYTMRALVLATAILAAGFGVAAAQTPQMDHAHPPQTQTPSPGAQGMPDQGMRGMDDMMRMMHEMMPMMERMRAVSPEERARMMESMRPMMRDMMPMMQGMMGGGPADRPAPANPAAPPSTREFLAANERMHRDMAIAFTGDADIDFVRGMIPHHQGAIDMAQVVLRHGKNEAARKWANDILREQQREISQMREWLRLNAR